MKQVYWRWKSDRLWQPAQIEFLGNGLARILTIEFIPNSSIIVSLDEIETKDVQK